MQKIVLSYFIILIVLIITGCTSSSGNRGNAGQVGLMKQKLGRVVLVSWVQ